MHNHSNCCEHNRVRYCKVCQVIYCEDCGKEWREYIYNWKPSPSVPYWITSGTQILDGNVKVEYHSHG